MEASVASSEGVASIYRRSDEVDVELGAWMLSDKTRLGGGATASSGCSSEVLAMLSWGWRHMSNRRLILTPFHEQQVLLGMTIL